MERAFRVLESIGARRREIRSKAGTKLDSMLVRYRDVKTKIEENGGMICDSFPLQIVSKKHEGKNEKLYCKKSEGSVDQYVDLITRNPGQTTEKWEKFCKETLSKLGLKKVMLGGEEAYIAKEWGGMKNPIRPTPNQLFVRCNAPTECMAMGKRDTMRHVLGCRGDVLCFDYPGSNRSEGIPSEGAYYLSGETMVEYGHHDLGYDWKNIWVFGFCLGGAVACHLAAKYHKEGINLSTQNAFADLLGTYKQQIWPANRLAPHGIDAIKSEDPRVTSRVQQDGFDNVEKLRAAANKGKSGYAFIINTEQDTTIGRHSHENLVAVADRAFEKISACNYSCPLSGNAHSYDVLGDPLVFKQFIELLVEKDRREAEGPHEATARASSILAS